ncbi:MAG: DbpA RNA binding domain-containing protein [Methylomonas sp.]|nr:DbpA RNA binding domain-containing protein [Methylomonas sp.]PPD21832.1 MAG: hypothetical protein CTY23_04435 [Methylomonas sp.]PPD27116.1 MAG: hypothetical protein CTY22_02820 [Methylomonas sp.]PPD39070.1 MAG: hypothetical protein CTY21_02815 [Methylomonas sp.]PPD42298.1 MAG: hypothetical protein CTY17_01895 [Methylomonas sp.]
MTELHGVNFHSRKFEKIKQRLQRVFAEENLDTHRQLILQASQALALDPADCAAALLYLSQPHLVDAKPRSNKHEQPVAELTPASSLPRSNVRYRLDVGRIHHIDRDTLITVLVDEAGVERKRLQHVDIRENYTLVDLPEGMPSDIFQLLSETTLAGRKLDIRRVKNKRRKTSGIGG